MFLLTKVTEDKNNLFRALSQSAYGTEGSHKAFRQSIVKNICKNWNQYSKYFKKFSNEDLYYYTNIKPDSGYNINCLNAVSEIEKKNIRVYTCDTQINVLNITDLKLYNEYIVDTSLPTIYLVYNEKKNTFCTLIKKQKNFDSIYIYIDSNEINNIPNEIDTVVYYSSLNRKSIHENELKKKGVNFIYFEDKNKLMLQNLSSKSTLDQKEFLKFYIMNHPFLYTRKNYLLFKYSNNNENYDYFDFKEDFKEVENGIVINTNNYFKFREIYNTIVKQYLSNIKFNN